VADFHLLQSSRGQASLASTYKRSQSWRKLEVLRLAISQLSEALREQVNPFARWSADVRNSCEQSYDSDLGGQLAQMSNIQNGDSAEQMVAVVTHRSGAQAKRPF